jgi:hypothetical protein
LPVLAPQSTGAHVSWEGIGAPPAPELALDPLEVDMPDAFDVPVTLEAAPLPCVDAEPWHAVASTELKRTSHLGSRREVLIRSDDHENHRPVNA